MENIPMFFSNLSIIFLLIAILPIFYFCFLYIVSFFNFIYNKFFKKEVIDSYETEIVIQNLPKYEITDPIAPPLYSVT